MVFSCCERNDRVGYLFLFVAGTTHLHFHFHYVMQQPVSKIKHVYAAVSDAISCQKRL